MHTSRALIVWTLRSRGDHDRALMAECSLPRSVDLQENAGVLQALDMEVADIMPMAKDD